jgi:hypothetical protein
VPCSEAALREASDSAELQARQAADVAEVQARLAGDANTTQTLRVYTDGAVARWGGSWAIRGLERGGVTQTNCVLISSMVLWGGPLGVTVLTHCSGAFWLVRMLDDALGFGFEVPQNQAPFVNTQKHQHNLKGSHNHCSATVDM